MKFQRPSNITLIVAAICFILAAIVWVVHGEEITPEAIAASGVTNQNAITPASVFVDPLAGTNLIPQEAFANVLVTWIWPTNIAELGPIPIADAATNMQFMLLKSAILTNPEWQLKYIFPGSSLKPISNNWSTTIFEDISTSCYYAMSVSNTLNWTTGLFNPNTLWISTGNGKIRSITIKK